MYKILIVDDEMLIRTHIKILIEEKQDKRCQAFIVCGEASNGIEALDMVEALQPDIIISDIRMPAMDGLQLSEEIKQRHPGIKLLVLSNYDDYEYVRGTLKNGAVDYILKHRLDRMSLLEALGKAVDTMGHDQLGDVPNKKSPNYLAALREKVLMDILAGLYKNDAEVKSQLQELGIKLETSNIIPVAMTITDPLSTAASALKDSYLRIFAVNNIIKEVLNDLGMGAACHVTEEKYAILLSFASVRSRSHIDSKTTDVLSRIASCLKKFLNLSACFSIGKLCESIVNISLSYQVAENSLKTRFHHEKSHILYAVPPVVENNTLKGLDLVHERRISVCLSTGDTGALDAILDVIFQEIQMQKLNLTSTQMIVNDLLSLINRISKNNGITLDRVYGDGSAIQALMTKLETLDEVKKKFNQYFRSLYSCICNLEQRPLSIYVSKATSYIRKHYSEDISLNGAAEEIGITSTYLSKLFKEETGSGFSEFLTEVRLEKAKSLMAEWHTNIADIVSCCGFNDYAYFFSVFKKKCGCTPKEYILKNPRI